MWTDPVWFNHLLKVWICFRCPGCMTSSFKYNLRFSYLHSYSVWRMETIILAKLNKPLPSLNKPLFGESLIYLLQWTVPKMDTLWTNVTVVGVCLRALSINFVGTGRLDHSQTHHFDNEIGFSSRVFAEKPSEKFFFLPTLFRI